MEPGTPNDLWRGRISAGSDDHTAVDLRAPTPTQPGPPAEPDFEIAEGSMLGEYRLEGLIDEGGMGSVFAAIHPRIGKRAAIKILNKRLCADPQAVRRFVDEARVVNAIGHRNIVDIFAFGETPDGRSYLVMEFLRGQTLRAWMATRRLTLAEVCSVLRPLARALQAAHAMGVIHRDLKPDNVFLVDDGDEWLVKLLDFGIAKLPRDDHDVEHTAIGTMIGTPQYIAPEQARGLAIDPRVDIYSLGCVAFELLTGRATFAADNAMEMITRHLMEPPAAPSTLAAVPLELDRLVVAMLAKTAAERPSLDEVCAVLDRVDPPRPSRGSVPKLADSQSSIAVTMKRPVAVPVAAPRRLPWRVLGIAAGMIATGAVAFVITSRWPAAHAPPRTGPTIAMPAIAPQPHAVGAATDPAPPPPPPPPAPAVLESAPAAPERPVQPLELPPSRPAPANPHHAKPRIRDIQLRIAPATAAVRLDAVVIDDAIAHVPLDGRPHRLSITAPSFEPKTILLDASTATPLRVELVAKPLSL